MAECSAPQQERENLKTALMEVLADIEHQRWADWQKYMHTRLVNDARYVAGEMKTFHVLEDGLKEHWERQIATPYADLSESEKQSDRDQVERYIGVIAEHVASRLAQREAEIRKNSWKGWACVLGTVRYSPVFDTRKEAENYPNRPKGTEVVEVYMQSEQILQALTPSE